MTAVRRRPRVILLCAVFTVALTWLDLWTKDVVAAALPCDPAETAACRMIPGKHPSYAGAIQVVDGFLDLAYAENRGAAFGMMRDVPEILRLSLFGIAAGLACVVLGGALIRGYGGTFFVWSVPLIVSGALGNLIDRLRQGFVVDFIRFHLHDGWEYPTFNVADITIAIGGALLLLDGFRREPGRAAATEVPAQGQPQGQ